MTGLLVAVALELLLFLALLTLGQSKAPPVAPMGEILTSFDTRSTEEPAPEPAESQEADVKPIEQPAEQQQTSETPKPTPPQPAVQAAPAAVPPTLIPMSPKQLATADISTAPKRSTSPANAPVYGPVNNRKSDDSKPIGTAPNGSPLYAARWYREPYENELSGYLSTAVTPGWGQIICRTAPDYRVEDCVAQGEYPANSRLARAVLAAAWQFRVRPPRKGGRDLVGEWVQIRITSEPARH